MKRLVGAAVGLLLLALFAGCSGDDEETQVGNCAKLIAALGYRPPFLPVTFNIDTTAGISVGLNKQIVTPIGSFSIEADILRSLDSQPDSTALVIRHRQNGIIKDDAYRICEDKVVVTLNGRTRIEVDNNRVLVDATDGTVTSIEIGQGTAGPGPEPVSTTATPLTTTTVNDLQTATVEGNKVNGFQFTASQAGTYRFQYLSGAYSVYPLGQAGPNGRPWRTAIFVYRGDRVPFQGNGDIDKDAAELQLADTTDSASKNDAEQLAVGSSWFEMDLAVGETVSLVAVDGRFSYGDNPGAVMIKISYVQRTTIG